jgi:NAD(P)H-dependent FMN reductase
MATLKIVIASTRPGRIGLPVGNWVTRTAVEHGGFDNVEVLDLAEINLPFLDEPHHPRARKYVQEHTLRWSEAVDSADAFVFVTPEYNFSMTASLKNAIDYLAAEWAYKPVGLVSYGGLSGGARAAHDIRQLVPVLKMFPLPEGVALPLVFAQVVDGEFVPTNGNIAAAHLMFDELVKVEAALAPLRVTV